MRESVTPMNWLWCQKILPLVYEDSLAYYEVLCKLRDKLNEVIAWLDGYEDDLKAYVDQKYAELLAEVNRQITEFQNQTNQKLDGMQTQLDGIQANVDKQLLELREFVNQSVTDLTNYVNTQIENLENRVNQQLQQNEEWVRQQIQSLKNQVQLQIAELQVDIARNLIIAQNYTDVEIAKLIKDIPMFQDVIVVCPVDGRTEQLQDCLFHMYQLFRKCAFTALEYDNLGITAQEWEDLGFTAKEFDDNGLCDMEPEDPNDYAFSGFTGLNITLRDNIYEITQYLRADGLTAAAYDALELAAQTFDNTGLSAYDYDWHGITVPA